MHITEYVSRSKQELDDMLAEWLEKHENDPEGWPVEMSENEWGDQELASRFGQT